MCALFSSTFRLLFTFSSALLTLTLTTTAIEIDTRLGRIAGSFNHENNTVHRFLNIPYAEPPIGALRWRPTQPPREPWSGTYDGTRWGNACVQPTMSQAMMCEHAAAFSEDCLYLNVFSPNVDEDARLRPVLVFIHGGGLMSGTACTQIYESSRLARSQDILVVTINYRLGYAAFLVDPALHATESTTGNGGANGFLDMIAALEWVQANIDSFGGDPSQVTVSGESGGGWAVCGLMLSPLARGLFRRSIQMSGSCVESAGKFLSRAEGYAQTKHFRDSVADKLVFKETTDTADADADTDADTDTDDKTETTEAESESETGGRRRVLTVDDLRALSMQEMSDVPSVGEMFLPTIDGYVFPLSTLALLQSGHVNGESTMIGTVYRESFSAEPFNMGPVADSQPELEQYYAKYFHGAQVQDIQSAYPFPGTASDAVPEQQSAARHNLWDSARPSIFDNERFPMLVMTTQQTDCWVRCGSLLQTESIAAHAVTRQSVRAYFYQYGNSSEPYDGATHGFDVLGLFGNSVEFINMVITDEFVALTMDFFGGYVNGGVDDAAFAHRSSTVQNGYFLEVVDDAVRASPLSDLERVRQRCKLWFQLGNSAFRNTHFCFGFKEMTAEEAQLLMEQMANAMSMSGNSDQEGEDTKAQDTKAEDTKADL